MALTRSLLKSMGIEEEKIDQIIAAHTDTVSGLKKERDDSSAEASAKLAEVQKELDALKDAKSELATKYEAEQKAFADYKEQVATDEARREKAGVYRKLLREAGIDEKRIESVLKVSDLSSFEVKDGKAADEEAVLDGIKKEWSDFIVQTSIKPAKIDTPPGNDGGGEREPQSLAEALRMKTQKKD